MNTSGWACEDLNLGPLPYPVPPNSSEVAASDADLEKREHRRALTVAQLALTSDPWSLDHWNAMGDRLETSNRSKDSLPPSSLTSGARPGGRYVGQPQAQRGATSYH